MLGAIAPRLTDRVMETLMFTSQQSRTRKANGDHRRALFEAGYGGHARGTHEPHLMRSSSLYVKATKRPAVTAGALLAGGAIAVALLRSRNGASATPPEPLPEAGDMAQLASESDPPVVAASY